MKYPTETLEDWINRINAEAIGLTEWEETFMECITKRFAKKIPLTDPQVECLERIYANKTK